MPIRLSDSEFEDLVGDALDSIPTELTDAMSNVVVLIEPSDPDDPGLLGLYNGVALTERMSDYASVLPDTITIYRDPILHMCSSPEEVAKEVTITVVHEIAHHFGISDEWLHANGWG